VIGTLLLALQASSAPISAPVVSARMTPDTVGVGEAVTIELRVRAPLGSEIRFPAVPDSSEHVEPLDPRMVRDASTSALIDRTAVYRLIAWDTGSRVLAFGDITVERNGAERRYRVTLPRLRVRSVLPTDSVSRQPRRARDLLMIPLWWWRLAVGGVVVLALLWFSWRAWRRRRASRLDAGPDAAAAAQERFAHADALGLLDAGELGRHALAHVGVMREYLAARFPAADRSRTGHELVAALTGADFPILPERVRDLLLRSEPIAFARAAVTPVEAREIAAEARAIVKDVETAVRSRAQVSAQRSKKRRRR
jgi:hypothetical protein